jgi:hypothetical protein
LLPVGQVKSFTTRSEPAAEIADDKQGLAACGI